MKGEQVGAKGKTLGAIISPKHALIVTEATNLFKLYDDSNR